jgi:hypothetical protein
MSEQDELGRIARKSDDRHDSRQQEAADELGILDRAQARDMADRTADQYEAGGRMVHRIIRKVKRSMDDIADQVNRDRD